MDENSLEKCVGCPFVEAGALEEMSRRLFMSSSCHQFLRTDFDN